MRCQRRQLPFLDPWHYPLGPRRLLLEAMRRAGRHSRLYSFFYVAGRRALRNGFLSATREWYQVDLTLCERKMTRMLDLTDLISSTANMGPLGDRFEQGFRRRPVYSNGSWSFSEPPGGLAPNPLLTVGGAMELLERNFSDIARRLGNFLSTEFNKNRPAVPELHASRGYGLLSDFEQLHLRLFFADPEKDLVPLVESDLLPFMVKEFGATHVCVIRPNYSATQSRLSLLKFFWAKQAFGEQSVKKVVMDDRILDSVLPAPTDLLYWTEIFFTMSPVQLALPIQLPGGFAVFFGPNIWSFPRAAVQGMLSNFNSSISFATSDEDVMVQSVGFRAGTSDRAYALIRMAVGLVNSLVDFATNPLNFLNGQQLKGLQQVQFVTALNLFMNDIRSLNATMSAYQRMSFCFSALDKLANIVAAFGPVTTSESQIFKAFFSVQTIRELRRISRDISGQRSNPVENEILASRPKRITKVQWSVRKQMRGRSTEAERLDWLWSYRNLRHGTFLRRSQFEDLFVSAQGIAPAELAQATMALLICFAASPKEFLDAFYQ
jgi:hypothetical protein